MQTPSHYTVTAILLTTLTVACGDTTLPASTADASIPTADSAMTASGGDLSASGGSSGPTGGMATATGGDAQATGGAVVADRDASVGIPPTCTPARAPFDSTILPVLEDRCGLCHGETPSFGAPYTLLNYDQLLELDSQGRRKADRLFARLADGTMPQAGSIRPTVEEFSTLTRWASCNSADLPYPSALKASRPVFEAPREPPAGSTRVELLADDYAVEVVEDKYKSFYFDSLVTEDKYVRRIAAQIDQAQVVHHITLHFANDGNSEYLYAWAPGTGAFEFPEGGLRIRPSDRFRVEIHYNNPRSLTGVEDNSGIIFYVDEPVGTEYGMLDLNTFLIQIPPNSEATITTDCSVQDDMHILAGMPHMHETGSAYSHTVERSDGSSETLVELSGWAFDQQYIYQMGVDIKAGDRMTINCTYQNDTSSPVRGGQNTGDEMCYDFVYVTPPTARASCIGGI